jgi:hypothetical protein
VKVGRAALDEDAIRMIEEHNPDIEFDWTRILKGGGEPVPERPERRQEPRPSRPDVAPAAPPVADEALAQLLEPEVEFQAPPIMAPDEPVTPVLARLGSEGLLRLRGRYAEMLARISERIQDREKQAELKSLAERLNPDVWVTEADVLAGLDGYEATFESLRGVIGQRRRRRRRKPQPE